MKPSELLAKSGWVQGTRARTADSESCGAGNRLAQAFCLDGALYRCCANKYSTYHEWYHRVQKILEKRGMRGEYSPIDFNDLRTTTKQDVIDLLVEAGL